jgi:hypothetical protein
MRVHTSLFAVVPMLVVLPGVAGAQAQSLTGAWRRLSLRDSAGAAIQPPEAPAFVIFSANGYFSQSAIPTGRPKNDKALAAMTKDELLARFEHVDVWRGTYTLSGNRLTRNVLAHIDPSGEGGKFVQIVRFKGDTITLTSPNPAAKSEARFVRVR